MVFETPVVIGSIVDTAIWMQAIIAGAGELWGLLSISMCHVRCTICTSVMNWCIMLLGVHTHSHFWEWITSPWESSGNPKLSICRVVGSMNLDRLMIRIKIVLVSLRNTVSIYKVVKDRLSLHALGVPRNLFVLISVHKEVKVSVISSWGKVKICEREVRKIIGIIPCKIVTFRFSHMTNLAWSKASFIRPTRNWGDKYATLLSWVWSSWVNSHGYLSYQSICPVGVVIIPCSIVVGISPRISDHSNPVSLARGVSHSKYR